MNKWKSIWDKRDNSIELPQSTFETFITLKKADGFDIQQHDNYYEDMFEQFTKMIDFVKNENIEFDSAYEVGCGSGVNLYLFDCMFDNIRLGGCDYSHNLLDIAKSIIKSDDLICMEAITIQPDKYDFVLSDSVFQYFQSEEYGYEVLEKMYEKANKVLVIREIHDKELEEEHLRMRRETIEDYDKKYQGLEKTFYDKERFIKFANSKNAKYLIVKPDNYSYWNSKFVFDFYLFK